MLDSQTYWSKFLKGDDSALGSLYHDLFEPLVFVAYHRVKNMEVARDIVSELFVSLLATRTTVRIAKWENIASIQAYLSTAVKNKAIDHIRAEKSHLDILMGLPQESLQANDLSILEELAHLPQKETELFQLHLDGYSNTEIAQQTKVSEKTVRNKLSSTRRKMALIYKSLFLLALWIIVR
jgi:RNA polymerase sigma factor (sigma-70 family)